MRRKGKAANPTELDAKKRVGKWLKRLGCHIYDEKGGRADPSWKEFKVETIHEGTSPDLLAYGSLFSKTSFRGNGYVAIEMKIGTSHSHIVHGFKQVLRYFVDYLWGAQYYVGGKPVELRAIVLATHYSPDGYIYKFEEGLRRDFIPAWPGAPLVSSLARVMWAMRDQFEKTFREFAVLPRSSKAAKSTGLRREMPMVGILAKTARPRRKMHWEAELLLSRPDWAWGIKGPRAR